MLILQVAAGIIVAVWFLALCVSAGEKADRKRTEERYRNRISRDDAPKDPAARIRWANYEGEYRHPDAD